MTTTGVDVNLLYNKIIMLCILSNLLYCIYLPISIEFVNKKEGEEYNAISRICWVYEKVLKNAVGRSLIIILNWKAQVQVL